MTLRCECGVFKTGDGDTISEMFRAQRQHYSEIKQKMLKNADAYAEETEEIKQETRESDDKESQKTGDKNTSTNVLTVTDDEVGDVIDSMSSDTALGILDSLHESPKVSTDLAEELGTTTQNVRYHLDKLEDSGLVEVGDICYSEKGREMSVYEPSGSPVMIVFGKEDTQK